jgi:hypothetical protein
LANKKFKKFMKRVLLRNLWPLARISQFTFGDAKSANAASGG